MKNMLKFIIPTLIIASTIWLVTPKYHILLTENMRDPMEGPAIWKLDQQTGKLFYCREDLEYSIHTENGEVTSKHITYQGPVCYPENPVNNSNRSIELSKIPDKNGPESKPEDEYTDEELAKIAGLKPKPLIRAKQGVNATPTQQVAPVVNTVPEDLSQMSNDELDAAIASEKAKLVRKK